MAKVLINDSTLSNMADEIRSQKGTQNTMTPDEMVTEVTNIGENTTATADDIVAGKTAITSEGLTTGTSEFNSSMELVLTRSYQGLTGTPKLVSLIKKIPNIDITVLTSFYELFSDWWRLEEIPNSIDTSNVTNFEKAFNNCLSLKYIPNINTNNGKSFKYMFNGCYSLENIPTSLNTSSATANSDFSDMFSGCKKIKTIPSIDTSKARTLSMLCSNCVELESVPTLDCSSAMYMGNMFSGCKKLTSVSFINTNLAVEISNMFSNCTSLVTAPQFYTGSCTTMRQMFSGCTNLVNVPEYDTSGLTSNNHYYMFNNCPNLSNDSLNTILLMCTNATSITSSKTLKTLGLTSAQATTCQSLSNYADFISAGWTTGY